VLGRREVRRVSTVGPVQHDLLVARTGFAERGVPVSTLQVAPQAGHGARTGQVVVLEVFTHQSDVVQLGHDVTVEVAHPFAAQERPFSLIGSISSD